MYLRLLFVYYGPTSTFNPPSTFNPVLDANRVNLEFSNLGGSESGLSLSGYDEQLLSLIFSQFDHKEFDYNEFICPGL